MTTAYPSSKWKPFVVKTSFFNSAHSNAECCILANCSVASVCVLSKSPVILVTFKNFVRIYSRISVIRAFTTIINNHRCRPCSFCRCHQRIWHLIQTHRQHHHDLLVHLEVFSVLLQSSSLALTAIPVWISSSRAAFFLEFVNVLVLILTIKHPQLTEMGNEGSLPSSENSTPASENQSLYSIHSRLRSSVESTQAPSPAEAPAPDLSHLTPQEIAQIRGVMERARSMQEEESSRTRQLQEEYMDFTASIEREASVTELDDPGIAQCSVCSRPELFYQNRSSSSPVVCADCGKLTCEECGSYHAPSNTLATQEWLCIVCEKRRHLLMATGMWYHGCHGGQEVPLNRHIIGGSSDRRKETDNQVTSTLDTSMISCISQASSRGSRESSDHTPGSYSWDGSRCGGDSGLGMDLGSLSNASSQNSELAKHVYEQNRVKGILLYMMGPCGPGATLPKSESDEFSDMTSEMDSDEHAMERSQPDVFLMDEFGRDVASPSMTRQPRNVSPQQCYSSRDSGRGQRMMTDKRTDSGSSTSSSGSCANSFSSHSFSEPCWSQDNSSSKDGKKVRRKLPPIPSGDSGQITKSTTTRTRPPMVKRAEGIDQEDNELVGDSDTRTCMRAKSRSRESVLEEDSEVARAATARDHLSAGQTQLSEPGRLMSLDAIDPRNTMAETSRPNKSKSHAQRAATVGYGPKDETDEIIDSLISIYGIPCTEAMKSLKKRLQEELRRATRDRKVKLEQLAEIRALQMQIGAFRLESDVYSRSKSLPEKSSHPQYLQMDSQHDVRKRGSVPQASASAARSSAQLPSRRPRHKRQSSDPMKSKFSPIKEDKDIETDFQIRTQELQNNQTNKCSAGNRSQGEQESSGNLQAEPLRDARFSKIKPADYTRIFYANKANSADQRLQDSRHDQDWDELLQPPYGSWSEDQMLHHSQPSLLYTEEEVSKVKEEKKAMLQYEIMRRKHQLEETARLKQELFKLARARQADSRSCGDIPRQYRSASVPARVLPVGIIKPIDDKTNVFYDQEADSSERSRDHLQKHTREISRAKSSEHNLNLDFEDDFLDSIVLCEDSLRIPQHRHFQSSSQDSEPLSNYSSTEYLAHKKESVLRQYMDESSHYGSDEWISEDYSFEGGLVSVPSYSQPALNTLIGSSQSLAAVRRAVLRKDPRIVSSVTLPNIFSSLEDGSIKPQYRDLVYTSASVSDTEGSPTSDVTPAMPLLDDVKAKSRTIIRNIGSGSRPVSAEFIAGDVEDMLNAMYRVESDNSVDADEPIMKHMTEGGVTILKQTDRKRRPVPTEPHRYSFPVKRILVTRDARDKSIKGSDLGMKIVGGNKAPGTKELGAYVTAIYPILADQLHGELDIGDQVLEWNGIHLTGLTAEEVQSIIAQTNGEIEMVVRARMFPVPVRSVPAEPGGHISSYDNLGLLAIDSLDLPSYRLSVKELPQQRLNAATVTTRQGVDPRQLAAELESIKRSTSTAENSPSSSQQDAATPSVSSPCSTPRSEPTSTSSDRQQRQASATDVASGEKADKDIERLSRERQSERRRRGHSPNAARSLQPHHSQRESHQHQKSSSLPQQQQQHSQFKSCSPNRQQQRQHSDTEMPLLEKTSRSRSIKEKKKPGEKPVLPAIPVSEKPNSAVTGSHIDKDPCPSPAMNDRLRASPPLDTRRSVKSRGSKKGKDSYLFPTKSVHEVEKGEDFGLGEIQLQISHDDFDNTLNIHVIKARNLRPRDLNGLSDPFVKLYLLPGRGPENKRRTKHIARTLNPEWHQTVMFQDVARLELQNKVLELTVWDYDRFKTNDFLGELVIELKEFAFLDNKPHWYPLKEHVAMQNFELPKASVPPPKPIESDKSKPVLPRQGKKHGVSSLRSRESVEKSSEDGQRRKSLGSLSVNGTEQVPTVRQVSSATNSPLPSRRALNSKSPIKTRSNGLLYR